MQNGEGPIMFSFFAPIGEIIYIFFFAFDRLECVCVTCAKLCQGEIEN